MSKQKKTDSSPLPPALIRAKVDADHLLKALKRGTPAERLAAAETLSHLPWMDPRTAERVLELFAAGKLDKGHALHAIAIRNTQNPRITWEEYQHTLRHGVLSPTAPSREDLESLRRRAANQALDHFVFSGAYSFASAWEFDEDYLPADVWACSVVFEDGERSRFYVRFASGSNSVVGTGEEVPELPSPGHAPPERMRTFLLVTSGDHHGLYLHNFHIGLVSFSPEQAQALLEEMDLVRALGEKRGDPHREMVTTDYGVDFYGSPGDACGAAFLERWEWADNAGESIEVSDVLLGFEPEMDQSFQFEYPELVIGADRIYWQGTPKHGQYELETSALYREDLERIAQSQPMKLPFTPEPAVGSWDAIVGGWVKRVFAAHGLAYSDEVLSSALAHCDSEGIRLDRAEEEALAEVELALAKYHFLREATEFNAPPPADSLAAQAVSMGVQENIARELAAQYPERKERRSLTFKSFDWNADSIAGLLRGLRIVTHEAEINEKYDDHFSLEIQQELERDYGWPEENGSFRSVRDDGMSLLEVVVEGTPGEIAALDERLVPYLDDTVYLSDFEAEE